MELLVQRIAKKSDYTVGRLFVDGKYLCDVLEDKVREPGVKVPGKTAIPAGRYRVVVRMSPKFKRELPRLLDVPGFEGILMHCLHPEMQVLTNNGWQNMDGVLKNPPEKCWSFNINTGKMELVDVENVIVEHFVGELCCCEYPQGKYNNASYRVTDKHKMLCEWKTAYGDRMGLVDAVDIPLNASFLACGISSSEKDIDEDTMTLCKLCMHIVADGYIRWYKTAKGEYRASVAFHYKKRRKINRVMSLLNAINIKHSIHENGDGSVTIRILHPDSIFVAEMLDPCHKGKEGKNIPGSFTLLPPSRMKELIEEYHFADGKYDNKRDGRGYCICSVNVNTLDTLQTMAFLCGFSSSMTVSRNNHERWKDGYELYIQNDNPRRTPPLSAYYRQPYNGNVFCLQNRNHTIVARNSQCDVPFILGNCGNSAADTSGCILVGENKEKGRVLNSRKFEVKLTAIIKEAINRGDEVWIEIE